MRESKQMFECFSVKLNALATQQSMCCMIKEKYNILEAEVWEFYVFKKSCVFFFKPSNLQFVFWRTAIILKRFDCKHLLLRQISEKQDANLCLMALPAQCISLQ